MLILGLLAVLSAGVATVWAWNAVAVELFAAPAVRFRHVLAVQTAIATTVIAASVLVNAVRRRTTA
jgi:hypothetical protein